MRCPECGHSNVPGIDCCAECGAPFPAETRVRNPDETRRDPDDVSFPAAAAQGARRPGDATSRTRIVAPDEDRPSTDDAREPRFLDTRRPRPLDAAPSMRELATSLRPGDARAIQDRPVRYAGFFRRGVAFVIDLVVLGIFSVVLTIAGLIAVRTGLAVTDLPRAFATDDTLVPLLSLGGSLMFVVYFTVLHAGTGQTIGKAALGIGVRTLDLHTIGTARSLFRVLGYFASAAVFGLGFIAIAITPRHRGWHDYVAGTCVVRLVPTEV